MFRERIVEWGRMIDILFNAWSEVKISRKIAVNTRSSTAATRRAFNFDTRRAEENRDLARTYIHPIEGNR